MFVVQLVDRKDLLLQPFSLPFCLDHLFDAERTDDDEAGEEIRIFTTEENQIFPLKKEEKRGSEERKVKHGIGKDSNDTSCKIISILSSSVFLLTNKSEDGNDNKDASDQVIRTITVSTMNMFHNS